MVRHFGWQCCDVLELQFFVAGFRRHWRFWRAPALRYQSSLL